MLILAVLAAPLAPAGARTRSPSDRAPEPSFAAGEPDAGDEVPAAIGDPAPVGTELRTAGVLQPGQWLGVGQALTSRNGWFQLTVTHDGDVVVHTLDAFGSEPAVVWRAGISTSSNAMLIMQADGNLAVRDFSPALPEPPAAPVWSTGTDGFDGAFLKLDDDGSFSVRHGDGARALWLGGVPAPDVGLAGEKHIVYERAAQRVWLVESDGTVRDNYLVSGREDSPLPGQWEVYSKSEWAMSYNGLVTMEHMVRFATGIGGGRLGFHSIPRTWWDTPIQTHDELGQFLSLGCVRQRDDKALQLYDWAPIGTPVAVLA